jgi:hypothetical protein
MKLPPIHPAFAAVLVLLVASCASTTYTALGTPDRVVEGVEFYETVTPARPYSTLGIIEDTRGTSGLVNLIGRYADIARKARAAGGDAVLLESANTKTTAARVVQERSANPAQPSTARIDYDESTTRRFQVLKWK